MSEQDVQEAPAQDGLTIETESAPPKAQAPTQDQFFTQAQVEEMMTSIRREEKDKLYDTINSLKEEVTSFRTAEEERKKQIEEAEAAEAERLRLAEEDDLSAKDLLQKKEQEWQEKFSTFEQELAQRDALLERERQFSELQDYRAQVLAQNEDNIIPELRDMVQGNSREEIDAAVNTLSAKSAAIIQQASQAMQQTRQQQQGTRPTAPSMGPLEENQSLQQTYSPEDIRNMSPAEYSKVRAQLLQAASQRVRTSGPYRQ